MKKNADTGLKDVNGAPLRLGDRVVYRYSQPADSEHEAISVEEYGAVEIVSGVISDDLDWVLFRNDNGKAWTIHDDDQQRITVIHD